MGETRKANGIKLVAFDFEGTLAVSPNAEGAWDFVRKSSWELIGGRLGAGEERKKMYDAYHRGEFDYLTWAKMSVDNLKKHGLTKQKLEEIVLNDMELVHGAEKLFRELRSMGIKSAIISGCTKNIYEIFARKFNLKVDYVRMAHEFHFDGKGRLIGGTVSDFDYEGKVRVLRSICKELGISMKQCAYVGDERNDIPIFRKVGLPVAINTENEELKAAARVVIEDKDISQLIKHL